ncbi:hypothetical protein L2E82_44844 [Cichorium intybus]|uniref:Uncharacterized protein n=1 Tax=Cichorium intybus TaxID=13427 RepID=A0ACB8ZRK0_CICIN|nr:hypothetical protein L2E82_44844 [Cichorium intybus]
MPQRNFMADTWASSQGAIFESFLKASCEIIDYGWTWTKDRAPVDTFLMGLATSIRERNDYEEEDNAKEKPAVPIVQLNVIRLLAELNVQVKKVKWLTLFCHFSLKVWKRVKLQYLVYYVCESYLSKLFTIGSAESKTLPPETNTERVELLTGSITFKTLSAGFQSIAKGLTNEKLCHRLLSLCSDVGLAAVSKSGSSGADFLGPLLPAVAEIWNISTVALQAVGGPYMWNPQWASAIQRISQGTPPAHLSKHCHPLPVRDGA